MWVKSGNRISGHLVSSDNKACAASDFHLFGVAVFAGNCLELNRPSPSMIPWLTRRLSDLRIIWPTRAWLTPYLTPICSCVNSVPLIPDHINTITYCRCVSRDLMFVQSSITSECDSVTHVSSTAINSRKRCPVNRPACKAVCSGMSALCLYLLSSHLHAQQTIVPRLHSTCFLCFSERTILNQTSDMKSFVPPCRMTKLYRRRLLEYHHLISVITSGVRLRISDSLTILSP